MKLAPASRAHSAHLEILQLLFFSSVASTAPRCDSSFLRQSILPESYMYMYIYTHFRRRYSTKTLTRGNHAFQPPPQQLPHTHSESPHTINNYMVHVHVHIVGIHVDFPTCVCTVHVALRAVCGLGICTVQAVRVKMWIELTVSRTV